MGMCHFNKAPDGAGDWVREINHETKRRERVAKDHVACREALRGVLRSYLCSTASVAVDVDGIMEDMGDWKKTMVVEAIDRLVVESYLRPIYHLDTKLVMFWVGRHV